MKLWIRSQDRENLIQSTRVFIAFDKNIATWDRNNMIDLGKYAKKERALEVLDEIQSKLSPKLHTTITKDGMNVEVLDKNYDVYEMPLE